MSDTDLSARVKKINERRLREPSVDGIENFIDVLVTIATIVFLVILLFTGATWALVAAGLGFLFLLTGNIAQTRRITEDNQKRLDYLIEELDKRNKGL